MTKKKTEENLANLADIVQLFFSKLLDEEYFHAAIQMADQTIIHHHPGKKFEYLVKLPVMPIIQRHVAEACKVSVKSILSKSRRIKFVQARQISMYLCKEITGLGIPKIAEFFGRDRTTVIHGIKCVNRMLADDLSLPATLDRLRHNIHAEVVASGQTAKAFLYVDCTVDTIRKTLTKIAVSNPDVLINALHPAEHGDGFANLCCDPVAA